MILKKIEFKIGDTVICKKSFSEKNSLKYSLIKDKSYKVAFSGFWDDEKVVVI